MDIELMSFGSRYRALVLGASGGVGRAIAATLSRDNRCEKTVLPSRSIDGLDLLDETSISDQARRLQDETFNLIICATGALTIDGVGPEKSIRQISPEAMAKQFAINAIGPALVLKHFASLLPKSEKSVIALLSARVGSIGDNKLGGWISYRASKAALNQIVRTASIEIARSHPLSAVVVIHPGTVATGLSDPYAANRTRSEPNAAAKAILTTLDCLGSGQTGAFFAYDGSRIEW
jgi:NAD(P)-dependent dehydrogenase (short-subunit alcohol dehydrogenase family)